MCMHSMSRAVQLNHFSRHLVMLSAVLVMAQAVCWADACPVITAGGPGQPVIPGAQGPSDQDTTGVDAGGEDQCFSLTFQVPATPYSKQSTGGWGALVLTFDRGIDGGSFIFTPKCADAQDGFIDPTSNSKTIQLGPGAYGLL